MWQRELLIGYWGEWLTDRLKDKIERTLTKRVRIIASKLHNLTISRRWRKGRAINSVGSNLGRRRVTIDLGLMSGSILKVLFLWNNKRRKLPTNNDESMSSKFDAESDIINRLKITL